MRLVTLLREVRACTLCEASLPEGPRPLVQCHAKARILIIGQAPGLAAHTSGVPWSDASGRRMRDWLVVSEAQFYDESLVALMPMGFCYPGKSASGDSPPRPECAPLWHPRLLKALGSASLTIFVGRHAFERYLADTFDGLTAAIRGHRSLLPDRIALPHPSPRNNIWLKKNPWFASATLPALRKRVGAILAS